MSNNPRILSTNLVDTATTLSSTSTSASFPITNIQDEQRTIRWHSASGAAATTVTLDISFSTVSYFNAVAFIQHNSSYTGTARIVAGSTPGGNDLADETFDLWEPVVGADGVGADLIGADGLPFAADLPNHFPVGYMRICYLTNVVEGKHLRLQVYDPDNADGYLALGRLYVGIANESTYGPSSIESRLVDPSGITYSVGGQVHVDRKTKFREVVYGFESFPSSDIYGLWYWFMAKVGQGTSFVLDVFPESVDYSRRNQNMMYCHIPPDGSQPVYTRPPVIGKKSLVVRESR